MSLLERPDKYDHRYGQTGFTKRDLYITDLEKYCDLIEEKLISTQEAMDKLLTRIETLNKPS